jgi:hypothetical protein
MNTTTPKSMLAGVTKGPSKRPHFVLLYGVDGVGKSTFGAAAPEPIFLGPEDGLGFLNVAKFPSPNNWTDVLAAVSDLQSEDHPYKSLVLDSLDWLEPLLWQHICNEHQVNSIEEVGGGFGKGFVFAREQWNEFIKRLMRLRNKMNIIAIAHAQVKVVNDPSEPEPFDQYRLKLNDKAADLWREASDCVFFAKFDIRVTKKKGANKARAFGEGARVMYTEHRPAFHAKNRFNLPFQMPLDWDGFIAAVGEVAAVQTTATDSPEAVAKLLTGHEAAALAFLVDSKWLEDGQSIADLPPARRKSILARPEAFLKAVADHEKSPTTETNE